MNTHAPTLSAEARRRLGAFRRGAEEALPGRIVEMRLFGSRARGDAKEDSDYDIAVFVRDLDDRTDVLGALSDTAYPHILEGFHIRPIVLPADYLARADASRTHLANEIARDGIPLR